MLVKKQKTERLAMNFNGIKIEKANFKVVGVYDPAEMKNKNSIQSLVKYYIQDFSKVADWGHHLQSLYKINAQRDTIRRMLCTQH